MRPNNIASMAPKNRVELEAEHEGSQQLSERYRQWIEAHNNLVQQTKTPPSTEGRPFIRHAKTLLIFLEGPSEINPIFKSVVVTFKTAVLYESERGENDNRVTCVFLAQTNMMEVLIRLSQEMEELGMETRDRETLEATLKNIEGEIKACGNSIDTYYKESRLVRYIHAQDWKERIAGHIGNFDSLRARVTSHLVLYTAVGVKRVLTSMEKLLNELTVPHSRWQRNVASLNKNEGHDWISDDEQLKKILKATEDPSLDLRTLTEPTQGGSMSRNPLDSIRDEINLDLNNLCTKNQVMFNIKLDLHTAKLSDTVRSAATGVIKALEGPYDRVLHKELRQLWKEMKWMFCIDRTTFVASLYEYLQDMHLSSAIQATTSSEKAVGKLDEELNIAETQGRQNSGIPIGTIPHKDAWALDYFNIEAYSRRIQLAFDDDDSGFVRISEVNVFARSIHNGFNLAQWCAYRAAGFLYETRLYQLRIHKLLIHMAELNMDVLPLNTVLCSFTLAEITNRLLPLVSSFSWKPVPEVPSELADLIKRKVTLQDATMRERLSKDGGVQYRIDGVDVIQLLFDKEAKPETYLFQFLVLMLEHWLDIQNLATQFVIDFRERDRISDALKYVTILVDNRRQELLSPRSTTSRVDLKEYYGGILLPYDSSDPAPDLLDYEQDVGLIDAFPIPTAANSKLMYDDRETYVAKVGLKNDKVPWSWGFIPDGYEMPKMPRFLYKSPVHLSYGCSNCKSKYIVGQAAYLCRECEEEVVLCNRCYELPDKALNVEGHDPATHDVLKTTLFFPGYLRTWVRRIAELYVSDVISLSVGPQEPQCHGCSKSLQAGMQVGVCVGHFDTCPSRFLCKNCIIHYRESPEDSHKNWHNVLVIPDFDRFQTGLDGLPSDEDVADESTITPIEEDRIASLETRVKQLEKKVDSGFSRLEKALAGGIKASNAQQVKQQRALAESRKVQSTKPSPQQPAVAGSQWKGAVGRGDGGADGSVLVLSGSGGSASQFKRNPSVQELEEDTELEDAASEPKDEDGGGDDGVDDDEVGQQLTEDDSGGQVEVKSQYDSGGWQQSRKRESGEEERKDQQDDSCCGCFSCCFSFSCCS